MQTPWILVWEGQSLLIYSVAVATNSPSSPLPSINVCFFFFTKMLWFFLSINQHGRHMLFPMSREMPIPFRTELNTFWWIFTSIVTFNQHREFSSFFPGVLFFRFVYPLPQRLCYLYSPIDLDPVPSSMDFLPDSTKYCWPRCIVSNSIPHQSISLGTFRWKGFIFSTFQGRWGVHVWPVCSKHGFWNGGKHIWFRVGRHQRVLILFWA